MISILSQLPHFILPFLIVICVIVFVHEFGHYWVARMCGVKVEEFSIGFGPEIFGWNDSHGTRWKVSWLPLGGYVKMFGDADPASTPGAAVHQMTEAEKKVSFFHQPVGKRIAVVAAGPAFNYIFAIIVLTLLFMAPPFGIQTPPLLCHTAEGSPKGPTANQDCFFFQGQHYTPAIIGGLTPVMGPVPADSLASKAGFKEGDRLVSVTGPSIDPHKDIRDVLTSDVGAEPLMIYVERSGEVKNFQVSPEALASLNGLLHDNVAAKAGLRPGDRVLTLDGEPISRFEDIKLAVALNAGTPIDLAIERDGVQKKITVTPEVIVINDRFGGTHRLGRLGITAGETEFKRWPFPQAVEHAVLETLSISASTLRGIGQMIMGTRGTEELGGPLRIAQMSGHVAEDGPAALILFMAMISINLGLVNLFPVPMLDGGHLFFYFAEHVRGRPLHEKVQEIGMRVGLVLVLSLMLFATWNDVVQMGVISFIRKLFS